MVFTPIFSVVSGVMRIIILFIMIILGISEILHLGIPQSHRIQLGICSFLKVKF